MKAASPVFFLVGIIIIASSLFAALGTINGKEKEGWESGTYSIVVATIHDIKKGEGVGVYKASINPEATLAGVLDPSVNPTIRVSFYVDPPTTQGVTTYVRNIPPAGATVLAVLEYLPINDQTEERAYRVTPNICTFMPEESGMVIIKGLDDPKVAETLKRIQKARAAAQGKKTNEAGAPSEK